MPAKTDIWMPLYIGDYLADTSHLDAERHGCYLLWMMHYWRKGPLPNDIQDLVTIGKLRSDNAPSIAQALLGEFFTLNEDGRYHQNRVDREKELWQGKRLQAKEKAEKAAASRWNKDASRNAPSIASSNPQAMLGSCPSPSPSPIKEQKPSRAKAASGGMKHSSDPRHLACKEKIFEYWKSKNKDECPWNGMEGKALGMLLAGSPDLTAQRVAELLRSRYRSEVNHSDRPGKWLHSLLSFGSGPLDRFGKPLQNGHLPPKEKTQYQIDLERQMQARKQAAAEAGL